MQASKEAGKVVWYSHLLKNFSQFVVIHTVRSFSMVNEAEVDVFLEFSCLFYDPMDAGNLISGSQESVLAGENRRSLLFLPCCKLGTFHMLGERDNHYSMETHTCSLGNAKGSSSIWN